MRPHPMAGDSPGSASATLLGYSDQQLIGELIRRNEERLIMTTCVWWKHTELRCLLFDAGKIITEWVGMQNLPPAEPINTSA